MVPLQEFAWDQYLQRKKRVKDIWGGGNEQSFAWSIFMHCFGKTEVVILVQLNFISLNHALFLSYFIHFTRLILRKSKIFTEFSLGRHVIKISFKLLMLLFTPLSLHITHSHFLWHPEAQVVWPGTLHSGRFWITDIMGGLCCLGELWRQAPRSHRATLF